MSLQFEKTHRHRFCFHTPTWMLISSNRQVFLVVFAFWRCFTLHVWAINKMVFFAHKIEFGHGDASRSSVQNQVVWVLCWFSLLRWVRVLLRHGFRCLFYSFLSKLCACLELSNPYMRHRSSAVSVVLTFNSSLNARAPSWPILLSVLFITAQQVVPLFESCCFRTSQGQCDQCCVDL